MASTKERLAVGVMTGTSLDGIDVALVHGTGRAEKLRARVAGHAACELGPLADDLRQAAEQVPLPATAFADLAWRLGNAYADAIKAVWPEGDVELIAVHGQTIAHAPPLSWQILNPAPIVERFRVPVACDLRQADLAAGGQGAPITPRADGVLFAEELGADAGRIAIVNLGGFCNVTVLGRDRDDVAGFDVCACNQVLDRVARLGLESAYDDGGRAAAAGTVDRGAADALHALLTDSARAGRSLGPGDEHAAWVDERARVFRGPDLAATTVSAIARTVAAALETHAPEKIIVAGGGARNDALVAAIAAACSAPVTLSNEHGVPVEAREAAAMAVLGLLARDGVATTVPAVTGARGRAGWGGTWVLPF